MVGLSKNATLVTRNIFPTNFLNGGFDKKKSPVLTDPVLKKLLNDSIGLALLMTLKNFVAPVTNAKELKGT